VLLPRQAYTMTGKYEEHAVLHQEAQARNDWCLVMPIGKAGETEEAEKS